MNDIQVQCELGQEQLMRMEYLAAERTLAAAEEAALRQQDFDALARLYMPLQEARRQRRQRCGEGVIRLDLIARDSSQQISGRDILEKFPHGQLLVAGWGSIQPAVQIRRLQTRRGLYVDAFLAAVYPTPSHPVVAIVPLEAPLPPPQPMPLEELMRLLPSGSLVMPVDQIPPPTYSNVMALWERLHAPFLAAADAQSDSLTKIEAYRTTIAVDYACELAHQDLSDLAKRLCKSPSAP